MHPHLKNSAKNGKYKILMAILISISISTYADLYIIQGKGDDGILVNGEVSIKINNPIVEGSIFTNKEKDIFFRGRLLPPNGIDAYSEEGNHYHLTVSPSTFGNNDNERRTLASKFLLKYFEESLLHVPKYAWFFKRLEYKFKKVTKQLKLNDHLEYSRYEEMINNIPIAAAYYRILHDNPDRKYSQERITESLGLINQPFSEDIIKHSVSIYKKESSIWSEE